MAEYISLLKILSLKLNVDTVQFFLNEKASAALPQRFPLFTAAVRHFRHRNPMVRTGAQTVILSVYAVGKLDASVERFAIGAESQEFCLSLVALLRKQVLHLMRVTRARLTPHAAQAPAGEAAQPSADEATARAAAKVAVKVAATCPVANGVAAELSPRARSSVGRLHAQWSRTIARSASLSVVRRAAPASLISSKMLGGASQIVSKIRVICNGT